jgi:hypothetical protein
MDALEANESNVLLVKKVLAGERAEQRLHGFATQIQN